MTPAQRHILNRAKASKGSVAIVGQSRVLKSIASYGWAVVVQHRAYSMVTLLERGRQGMNADASEKENRKWFRTKKTPH